jgi:hypothetical protein
VTDFPPPAPATPPVAAPAAPATPQQRPEVLVGAAFAGGVALALLLKLAGRGD